MKIVKTVSKTDTEEVQEELTVFSKPVYDFLKKMVMIFLPAASALYLSLSGIWGLPYAEQVVGTVTAITAFLGVCLGISSKRYNNSDEPHDGSLVVTRDGGGVRGLMLELDGDPEMLADQQAISFKVRENPVYDPTP